ncbi:hypothetical protein N0V95_007539 [Ascochyta clinopodiicola]|nr:hypothetical protein N0V95_007539 [Ascochyta clinopodiicola]
MDPQTDLPDLVEDLEVNIDELSSTLTPLLPPNSLSETSASLPLLEKAKLHVLAAYSIESLLFSTLLASGADAKSHALFAELARLKGYFTKIKDAEAHIGREEKRARLDVGAAQRFIKHGLAGNERYDEMRKERVAREKERGLEKARALTNKKFSDDEATPVKKRGVQEVEDEEDEEEGTPAKKSKLDIDVDADTETETPASNQPPTTTTDSPTPAKKKRGRPSKKDRASASTSTPQKSEEVPTSTPARATRSSAPKTRSEAFAALAADSPASATKGKK